MKQKKPIVHSQLQNYTDQLSFVVVVGGGGGVTSILPKVSETKTHVYDETKYMNLCRNLKNCRHLTN